jgi:hypothetical protein
MTTTTTSSSSTTKEEQEEVDEFVELLVWLYEHRGSIRPESLVWLLRSGVGDGFYLKRVKHDDDIVDIIAAGVEAVVEEEDGEK